MIDQHQLLQTLLISDKPIPAWWKVSESDVQTFLNTQVHRGQVQHLCDSNGGRPVKAVFYGKREDDLFGPANFNSALGGGGVHHYCRRDQRKHLVLVLFAGSHGAEPEGIIGTLSAISIMETGNDLAGQPQPALRAALDQLRLIVIPLANPDGRARVPYDGWVGLPNEEMHKVNQGTRRDGSLYGWPGCKQVHPMQGDVGFLGGYFDDAGINISHDEWFGPMYPVTSALFKLVRHEAPDMLINLHSYEFPPGVLRVSYVPMPVKQQLHDFATQYYEDLTVAGLPHLTLPTPLVDGDAGKTPPALNLSSALWHAGCGLSFTHESPQGFSDVDEPFDYDQLLQLHHVLFSSAARWLRR